MSLIAEWTHELHVLPHAFETVPDLELSLEETHAVEDEQGTTNAYYFWARADDFDAFEEAMENDPHCGTVAHLSDVGERRLYRTTASEVGSRAVLYSVVAERDIVVLDAVLTREGVRSRARAPSREAIIAFKRTCEERELWFSLDGLYRERGDARDYGITAPQREALLEALNAGYFDVPRTTTLEDLAAEFGISDQALSARLRRGQAHLLRHTLASGEASTGTSPGPGTGT